MPFASESTKTPGDYEYDGDTGNIVYPDLFSDDEPSTIDHRDAPSTDKSVGLDTYDGGFSTITNLVAEGIRSKSTFEVVEVDASSYCVSESLQSGTNVTSDYGEAEVNAHSSSNNSPSFPDGAILDRSFEYHNTKHMCGSSPYLAGDLGNHTPIDQDENHDECIDDRSTALSSLTNNESMFLRWLSPKERVDMLFDPFRDAMRPPLDERNGLGREVSGLNRLFLTSAKNLSSIFRPRPHPEFHLNHPQRTSVISTTSSPENLVITTTHSRITPSVCSTGSGMRNASIQDRSQAQVREIYGAAVLRSYQHKYPPVMQNSSSSGEDSNRKRFKVLLMAVCFVLVLCVVVSVSMLAGGKDHETSTEYVTNTSEQHHEGTVSLPNACCIKDTQGLDEGYALAENIVLEEEFNMPVLGDTVATLPSDSIDPSSHLESQEDTESVEVVFASTQNNEPPTSPTSPTPQASHIVTPHVASINELKPSHLHPSPALSPENIFSPKLGAKTEVPTSTTPPTKADTTAIIVTTPDPTKQSTALPTEHPAQNPTNYPTHIPTKHPSSNRPSTKRPSKEPSKEPSTRSRTTKPSPPPSPSPTPKPFIRDTSIPVGSTNEPTDSPSLSPVQSPTYMPSSVEPTTAGPTMNPVKTPITAQPSYYPSVSPMTAAPTKSPSNSPTTGAPSLQPVTVEPTNNPTAKPVTYAPSSRPSNHPNQPPTATPSLSPLMSPTNEPSSSPSSKETAEPTSIPTLSSLRIPTAEPTIITPPSTPPNPYPSINPTDSPTNKLITVAPSLSPISDPTPVPSPGPSIYVTSECIEKKFSYTDNGCTNVSGGGGYDIVECCEIFYGSFSDCEYFDICGVYTQQPSPAPTEQPSPEPIFIVPEPVFPELTGPNRL